MPAAHQIIHEVAGFMGLTVGHIDFPDYRSVQQLPRIGKRGLDIVSELAEPWNQFASVQYVTQVRDRTLSVVKVDWASPTTGGYVIRRGQHSQQQIMQEAYLDQPRLNEVQKIIIRGAAYTKPKLDLGLTTRTEYFRNITTQSVGRSIGGQVTASGDTVATNFNPGVSKEVVTETSSVELLYGDKVLNREETVYVDDELTSRTRERFWYFEPAFSPATGATTTLTALVTTGSPTVLVSSAAGFPVVNGFSIRTIRKT
jgi:hypothetical protein